MFSNRVAKYITPQQYNLLDDDRYNYFAEFKKYKSVRQSNYCDECGHFTGYSYRDVGIGKPYRYRRASGVIEVTTAIYNKAIVKQITNSNVLADRVLNPAPLIMIKRIRYEYR